MKIQSRIAGRAGCFQSVLLLCLLMVCPTISLLGGEKKSNEEKTQASSRAAAYYHFSQARLLEESGDFLKAQEEYKKAVQQDPKSSNLYIEMANAYLRHRRVRDAIQEAENSIKLR
jgi:Tfp pilus assembly protein PilF